MKKDLDLNKKRGQRLKECREAARMTQENLAEITDYSVQTAVSYTHLDVYKRQPLSSPLKE